MAQLPTVCQTPAPGNTSVYFCGDCVRFILTLSLPHEGSAFIRTNLGRAAVSRREILARVEHDDIKLDEGWYDIKMRPMNSTRFEIVLPLYETGHFQAKCFFLPQKTGTPVWPCGENSILNVEPAGTCCANIIYNAFVRQFGKSKTLSAEGPECSAMVRKLDDKGYTVIPESGKFRDLKQEIHFIFTKLGCRILHLLPIHPTPTTYARMGRFGSPYAALNFTDVDPALARFDPAATPLEQFMELADMVHFYNGYLFLDMAINHTGWAASIHESHPEWLVRSEDGKIEQPGAWGVVWADLTRLDYTKKELWQYMANIFILWCRRGVDGFRCDAGYMIPKEAWEYIVARVRLEYPETLFLLEGLGGHYETTCDIMNQANFNWAYSELFQQYESDRITEYLTGVIEDSSRYGSFVHYAETHDNNRLAAVSHRYARMRTGLSALLSVCGGFGFANGLEWFAAQKIDVHEATTLNWGNSKNQVDYISRLNLLLKIHPAFFSGADIEFIDTSGSNALIVFRHHPVYCKQVLILINLDCDSSCVVSWQPEAVNLMGGELYDLISSVQVRVTQKSGGIQVKLAPGEIMVLSDDPEDPDIMKSGHLTLQKGMPQRVYIQKLKAVMLRVHTWFHGYRDLGEFDESAHTLKFADDPVAYIRDLNTRVFNSTESRVIIFDWETDRNRQVMVPPGFFLMIKCKKSFRAVLSDRSGNDDRTLEYSEGLFLQSRSCFFALFMPMDPPPGTHRTVCLDLRVFDEKDRTQVCCESLLYLAHGRDVVMSSDFSRKEILTHPSLKLLSTSQTGGMMRAAAWWGKLESRYDALLAANLNPDMPENRWIFLSRCRIWAVYQDHSVELSLECLETFTFDYQKGGLWCFHVPTSEGKHYAIELHAVLGEKGNHGVLSLSRPSSLPESRLSLPDKSAVQVIIRPHIEDRGFHETTKAFSGPETHWPQSVTCHDRGFVFTPDPARRFSLEVSKGQFVLQSEWDYMVHRPLEASRGLDPESDLFSPGYFKTSLLGEESFVLDAYTHKDPGIRKISKPGQNRQWPFQDALYRSLEAFLVKRGDNKSVVAGYPWFLDWGRDSLIFTRSLIELERFDDAESILRLFARFEDSGTLPNMICGPDATNRETSDAPLWFIACVRDLVDRQGHDGFLDQDIGGRTIRRILLSMGHSMIHSTPTGVVADPGTGLLYSPSHFTWMDTNFPAGTPRQGYPVEIQALWHYALDFFSRIDTPEAMPNWQKKALQVQEAILEYYYDRSLGYFSDCLHCEGPAGAASAVRDDAMRPNQLFLVTLEVIRDRQIITTCLETCMTLLVPGGIRSLSNRALTVPLPVELDGELLNDPYHPYAGRYEGDEDRSRKPAYHNGTAWSWPFPVFCEAWVTGFGPGSRDTAKAWLSSAVILMRKGAAGYIPEILDGDAPHTPRGCDAQAWSSSEFARVFHKLSRDVL